MSFFYLSIFKNWFQCEVFKVLSPDVFHPAWRLRDERYAELARILGLPCSTIEEGVESYAKACGELGKRVGIKMNFEGQGLERDTYMANVEKLAYLAYEDQCSPANPRVPMVEDMVKIFIDAYDNKEFLDEE